MKFIFYIFLGLGLVITTILLDWPIWVAYLGIIIVGVCHFIYQMWMITKSQNLKEIEKQLTSMRRNPIYAYYYEFKNDDTNLKLHYLDEILKKYKKPFYQHSFSFFKAITINNVGLAKEHAGKLEGHPFANYASAYIAALEGRSKEALDQPLQKKWMIHAVNAIYYYQTSQAHLFEAEAKQAINSSFGVQFYINTYFFKSLQDTLKASIGT